MVMVATKHNDGLIDRLPLVSGRYEPFADLGSRSWFRTGGAAEAKYTFFAPASLAISII